MATLIPPTANANCFKLHVRETAIHSQVIMYCYSLSGLFNEKPGAPLLSLSIWKRLFLIRLPKSNRCFHQVLFAQMTGGTVIAFSSEQKLLQSGLQRSTISLRGLGRASEREQSSGEGGVVSVKQPTTPSLEFLILSDPFLLVEYSHNPLQSQFELCTLYSASTYLFKGIVHPQIKWSP